MYFLNHIIKRLSSEIFYLVLEPYPCKVVINFTSYFKIRFSLFSKYKFWLYFSTYFSFILHLFYRDFFPLCFYSPQSSFSLYLKNLFAKRAITLVVDRSSHQKCSIKKLFLKILQYSQKKNCIGVSF